MSKFCFNQKVYHFLVFMAIAFSPTLSLTNFITRLVGIDTSLDTIIVFAVVTVCLFLFLLKNIFLFFRWFFWIFLGILVLFFSMVFHSTLFYFKNVTNDIIYNSIYFIIGTSICLNYKTIQTINIASKYSVAVCFLIILVDAANGNVITDHDMVASYVVLTPTVLLMSDYSQNHRLSDLVYTFIGVVCIIFYGTRGPLLALVVSYTALVFAFYKTNKKFVFCIAICILVFFYKEILLSIRDVLIQMNLGSSRIIDMLIAGNINDENGRKILQDTAIEYIRESPFVGLGLYGNMARWGFYPHNLFIELFVQVGIPVSIVVVTSFAIVVVQRYKTFYLEQQYFVVVMLISILAKLMVTGSYLNESSLFLLFGFILNYGRGLPSISYE